VLALDAFAGVGDVDVLVTITGFVRDGDAAAFAVELDGVAEEVDKDLFEAGAVQGEVPVLERGWPRNTRKDAKGRQGSSFSRLFRVFFALSGEEVAHRFARNARLYPNGLKLDISAILCYICNIRTDL